MFFVIRKIEANEQADAAVGFGFFFIFLAFVGCLSIFRRFGILALEFELDFVAKTEALLPAVEAMARLLRGILVRVEVEDQK